MGEVCECKWSYMLEVPDIDFIRPCGVVVFAAWTCVVVSVMLVVCSLSVFLSIVSGIHYLLLRLSVAGRVKCYL